MRSRFAARSVTELGPFDHELRLKNRETPRGKTRSRSVVALSREVLDLLASRLTENGRELEGASRAFTRRGSTCARRSASTSPSR